MVVKAAKRARLRALGASPLLALLLCGCACSRPEVVSTGPGTTETGADISPRQHQGNQPKTSAVPSEPSQDRQPSTQRDRPLQNLENLPAGTLVTVRLQAPVYASTVTSETSFEAVVAEPVVVEGNTLIPRGASVAGRVESARTSKLKPNRGYVRLALQSVQVGDVRVPVQTASLFAREAPLGDDPISAIHLEKGRRLTFRLAEPSYPSTPPSKGTR